MKGRENRVFSFPCLKVVIARSARSDAADGGGSAVPPAAAEIAAVSAAADYSAQTRGQPFAAGAIKTVREAACPAATAAVAAVV